MNTMRTAKEVAHVFGSARTTEVLTVLTVFLGIAGRDRSIKFSLNMKTNSSLYPKTIQGKPIQYINTMRSSKEAAHVFSSARTTEVLPVMTVFLGITGIAGRDLFIEFSLNMMTTSALYPQS